MGIDGEHFPQPEQVIWPGEQIDTWTLSVEQARAGAQREQRFTTCLLNIKDMQMLYWLKCGK
jgi:hypothetical protein